MTDQNDTTANQPSADTQSATEVDEKKPFHKRINTFFFCFDGLVLGSGFAAAISYLFTKPLVGSLVPSMFPTWTTEVISWGGATISFAYLFIYGLIKLEPVHTGVPLFLGKRQKFYEMTEGWNWWLPPPFGGVLDIYTGIRTYDRRKAIDNPMSDVLSMDGINVSVSVLTTWSVVNVWLFSGIEKPDENIEGLVSRNVRIFCSKKNAVELPATKTDISEEVTKEGNIIAVHQWGAKFNQSLVDDINLPPELVRANEQKEIEKAQRESEATEMGTVTLLMEEMKKKFPDLTDKQILDAVQAERKKITRVVVEGDAGDFTKGAATRHALEKGGRGNGRS